MFFVLAILLSGVGLNLASSFQMKRSPSRPVIANHDSVKIINNERSFVANRENPLTLQVSSVGLTNMKMSQLDKEIEKGYIANHENVKGNVAFLIPEDADVLKSKFGSKSPVENPTILDAVKHISKKSQWFSDNTIETFIISTSSVEASESLRKKLENVDALIALNLHSDYDLKLVDDLFKKRNDKRNYADSQFSRQCNFAIDCATKPHYQQTNRVSNYLSGVPSISSEVFPWSDAASAKRLEEQMTDLFERWTSDEFTMALMLFFNQFSGHEIDWVKHSIDATWEKGPIQNAKEFYSMVDKCGDCVVKCIQDEKCKECIDALNSVDTRDQVSSYTTIVSYESELLRDFSFCILQKNNIFNCDAKIPEYPKVTPITSWRGNSLTHEIAQQILIAHLDDEDAPEGGKKLEVSWIVACGANVAYDQFPSQNQIFYKSANGRGMWYDPVFRVETIDGRNVWCKRHYKVRDGKVPGTFHLSVLDNGVTSNEFWTIVAVADDLSWIVFHYAGAASAVGQRYLGGLLCTADGLLPPMSEREKIWKAMKTAGIEAWELYVVDNDTNSPGAISAGEPPLDFYRAKVLASN